METKKLTSYLTCDKFNKEIYETLEQRYKCFAIKGVYSIEVDENQEIILFPYGVFVAWNVSFENLKFFLDFLRDFEINSFEKPIIEELSYSISNDFKIHLDNISLNDDSRSSKISISYALSQNVKLEQFENEVQDSIDDNSSIPNQLAKDGKINLSKKEISKKIGQVFLVKNKINLHYDLLDTPDYFWEYPEYENTYESIIKYLDIKSRVEVLNKRVEVLQELLDVLGNEQKHKYSSFLEWIIIILIGVEIFITLVEHLFL